jgi:hypothetical protein
MKPRIRAFRNADTEPAKAALSWPRSTGNEQLRHFDPAILEVFVERRDRVKAICLEERDPVRG